MIRRHKDPTPEHGDPGDENDFSYEGSIVQEAMMWALDSPPHWKLELLERFARQHFGKK